MHYFKKEKLLIKWEIKCASTERVKFKSTIPSVLCSSFGLLVIDVIRIAHVTTSWIERPKSKNNNEDAGGVFPPGPTHDTDVTLISEVISGNTFSNPPNIHIYVYIIRT